MRYLHKTIKTLDLAALLLVLLLSLVKTGDCQDDCTQGFPDINSEVENSETLTKQLVVPDYTFQCSAIITAWEAIVHIEKQTSTIQFQVWRRNQNQTGYHLVGTNSFKRKHLASDMQKQIKYVYLVTDTQSLLQVEPGDIVGVFASGINIHYDTDREIDIYSAELDAPLGGIFSPLNLDPAFNRRLHGAPLIAVQMDTNRSDMLSTATIPHGVTLPGRPIESTEESTETVQLNKTTTLSMNTLTTSRHGGTSAWTEHKELIIGVSICGVVMILLCFGIIIIAVMLLIRAQKRKRVGSMTTDGSAGDKIYPKLTFRNRTAGTARDLTNGGTNGVCGIHMAVLLTESNSANTSEDHSYAYISSDLIKPGDKSKPRPIVRSRPPTLPPARITVRQNPCYSSTEELDVKSEADDSGPERVENVYDLPVFASKPRQAREYEVPIKSPPKSKPKQVIEAQQHIYELTDNNQYV